MTSAVIFDCDGVLVDSEVIAQRLELEQLTEIGLTYDPKEYTNRFLGTGTAEYFSALDKDCQMQLGHPLPTDFAETLSERARVEMDTALTAIKGVHRAINALTLPKAVASGSSVAGLERKLRKVDLFETFAPHVYSSQLVALGKPAPDIYIYTAQKLDVEQPGCVVIEDSVNGVKSALAAGMIAIGFVGGGHCSPAHAQRLSSAGAKYVIERMDQLPLILRGLE